MTLLWHCRTGIFDSDYANLFFHNFTSFCEYIYFILWKEAEALPNNSKNDFYGITLYMNKCVLEHPRMLLVMLSVRWCSARNFIY